MLTYNPKISRNSKGDIFEINFPENDEKHDKIALMEIWKVFGRFHMLSVNARSETALFIDW